MFQKIAVHFGLWPVAWLIVYAVNLIVPLQLGWLVTNTGGRAGMFVAVFFIWLLGHSVSVCSKDAARGLVLGGTVVALSQTFLIFHFAAGMVSLKIVAALRQGTPDKLGSGVRSDRVRRLPGDLLDRGAVTFRGLSGWLAILPARR